MKGIHGLPSYMAALDASRPWSEFLLFIIFLLLMLTGSVTGAFTVLT